MAVVPGEGGGRESRRVRWWRVAHFLPAGDGKMEEEAREGMSSKASEGGVQRECVRARWAD